MPLGTLANVCRRRPDSFAAKHLFRYAIDGRSTERIQCRFHVARTSLQPVVGRHVRIHSQSRQDVRHSHDLHSPLLPALHADIQSRTEAILTSTANLNALPDEVSILAALQFFDQTASRLLSSSNSRDDKSKKSESTATSALLETVDARHTARQMTQSDLLASISAQAVAIVEHATVFLTPAILKQYISLQARLEKPRSFPHVLRLYRTKPIPRTSSTSSTSMSYQAQNPSAPSTAIDTEVATAALAAAIKLHELPLCLSIIDETYCTTSYARSKLIRMALLPGIGAALLPVAAYTLANRFALLQDSMDQGYATGVAMAGIFTYTAAVSTMGYVALTTSNDQMVRVSWATGLPLWERWLREEERAAVEKIAKAWGFAQQDRWGDEEGSDWDELREWTGVRGMVLDRVSLMEGME